MRESKTNRIISPVPIQYMPTSTIPTVHTNGVLDRLLGSSTPNYTIDDKAMFMLSNNHGKSPWLEEDSQFSINGPYNIKDVMCFHKLTVCSKYFFDAKNVKNQHLMTVMIYLMREIHGRMIKQLKNLTDISSSKLSILESLQSVTTDYIHQHDKHLHAFMTGEEYLEVPTMAPYKDVIEWYHKILKDNFYDKYKPIAEAILYSSSLFRPSSHANSGHHSLSSMFNDTQFKAQLGGNTRIHSGQSDPQFDDIVSLVNKIDGGAKRGVLKLFYAPWCHHSKPVMKIFEAMKSTNYEFDVKMIDCHANEHEKHNNKIKSYPTIRFYPTNNSKHFIDFNKMFSEDTRTLVNFEKFVSEYSAN